MIDLTPMQAARSRELVASAMAGFAAQDINPVYGAGQPLVPVRPKRQRHVEIDPTPRNWLPIIDEACERHRVHRKDVLAGWKSVKAVACRQDIWAALRATTKASLATIGRRTGGFHHTTVMHGLAKREARLAEQAALNAARNAALN